MKAKLNYVQVLRGIAALLVFFYHGKSILNNQFGLNLGDFIFSKGALGVELFFIISGFIMVISTVNIETTKIKYSRPIDFFLKRLIRIVPLYYVITFFWIVLSGKFFLYFFGNLKITLITSLLFISYTQFPVVLVGWSLNYEMFFYLLFATSLNKPKFRYQTLAVFYIVIVFLRYTYIDCGFIFKTIINPVIDYFAVGVLLGLFSKKALLSDKVINSLVIISTILFSFLLLNIIDTKNHYLILMLISFFAVSFILLDFRKTKSIPPKVLIFFGDISYSFYLIHLFVIILANKIMDRYAIIHKYGLPLFALIFVVVVLSSILANRFIEKPWSNYCEKSLFTKKNRND